MANRINTKAELSFYGFSKPQISRPRWNAIANQLGVRPTTQRYANITDNSNKQSKVYKDFVRAVKTSIQTKYTFDNQVIIQQFSFNYRIRFKEDKGRWGKWFPKTANLQVQGRRFGLFESIQQSQQDEINRLEESNAEIDNITEPILGDPVIVPIVGGKLVAKGVRVARMKKAGAFRLDADFIGDASWDRKEDTCVFDYLFHKYAGKKGFKKTLPDDDRDRAYENLDTLFSDEEYNNSLENGVNTEQLLKFCERFDVSMYAFDKNEKLIHYYRSKNSKYSALIYIVSNEHFYPIEAEEKRKSICAKNREADKPDEEKKNWKSDDFAFENIAGKEGDYQVVYPTDDEPTGNEYALKIILEKNILPNPKSLRVDANTIISFKIADTLYLTEHPEKEVLKYCGDNFKGQSVNSLLMDTWKEVEEGD